MDAGVHQPNSRPERMFPQQRGGRPAELSPGKFSALVDRINDTSRRAPTVAELVNIAKDTIFDLKEDGIDFDCEPTRQKMRRFAERHSERPLTKMTKKRSVAYAERPFKNDMDFGHLLRQLMRLKPQTEPELRKIGYGLMHAVLCVCTLWCMRGCVHKVDVYRFPKRIRFQHLPF